MVNRRGHPKCLGYLLLIALASPSVSVWGGAPQSVSTQDVGSGLPALRLLPRTPFSLALWADNSQPMAQLTEDQAADSSPQEGVSKPSEREGGSVLAASQPASASPSPAVKPEGQSPPAGYDGPRTTEQGPLLTTPSAALWQRVSQAMTALRAELASPSLLPRTPLSPALWTEGTQAAAKQTEDEASSVVQEGVSKPSETGSGSALAASQSALPQSQAVKPGGQPPAQDYNGPEATEPESPPMIPPGPLWQRASQAMTALRAELASPSLLPRTPLSRALWTEDTPPAAEQTKDEVSGAVQEGASNLSETDSSALAASPPAPVPPSHAVKLEGQSPPAGYDGPRTTDQGPLLTMPSAAVWRRAAQAMSALRAELPFPSLLPRTPLSPVLWTEDTQPAAEQTEDEASGAVQVGASKPSETGSSSALTDSQPTLPKSQAVKPGNQPVAQGYNGPQATDPESPLMMPSAPVWQRASQAITILHVEPASPGLFPRSPVSPDRWTYEAQPVAQQAKKGEQGKKEEGKAAAFQPPPVLLAALMDPGDQPPAQGHNESITKDHGEPTTAPPEVSEHSSATKSLGGRSGARGHDGPPIMNQGQAASASQTGPLSPSSAASQKVQPTAQVDHGPYTTNHASTNALRESAGQFPSTPSGKWALRDPFKLPPPPRPEQEEKDDPNPLPANRPPGSRGLLVEQLKLKGVVRDSATQKMIAVVTAPNNRAYFLREGEAVYDGVVSKITPDAVYFKGNIFNSKREVHFREVVKILSPAPGEIK